MLYLPRLSLVDLFHDYRFFHHIDYVTCYISRPTFWEQCSNHNGLFKPPPVSVPCFKIHQQFTSVSRFYCLRFAPVLSYNRYGQFESPSYFLCLSHESPDIQTWMDLVHWLHAHMFVLGQERHHAWNRIPRGRTLQIIMAPYKVNTSNLFK